MSEVAAEAEREERKVARFLLSAILQSESFFMLVDTKKAVEHLRSGASINIAEVTELVLPLMNFIKFTEAPETMLNGIMRLFDPCDIEEMEEEAEGKLPYKERN